MMLRDKVPIYINIMYKFNIISLDVPYLASKLYRFSPKNLESRNHQNAIIVSVQFILISADIMLVNFHAASYINHKKILMKNCK